MKINSSGLRLAELRYYNDEGPKGLEVSQHLSYGVLYTDGNDYVNILGYDNYPVFKRAIGTTNVINKTGEEYGARVVELTKANGSGPAWLIIDDKFGKNFPEEVKTRELEDYVLSSKFYFKDRADIARDRLRDSKSLSLIGVLFRDSKPRKNMEAFFEERKVHMQKIK